MRTYMVIPTYWCGPNGEWQEGDEVYDHATPISEEGTLLRALQSLEILEDKHFTLIVLGAITNSKYLKPMEEKLRNIILKANLSIDTILFTDTNLYILKTYLCPDNSLKCMLQLKGYSNIRNLCLIIPYILDAEIALLIDDDEVFEDPKYINKAKEFIGRKFYGNTIDGVAGYYLNEDNEYYDKVNIVPWMTYWDRFGGKREAFDMIIGSEPRLKQTPFAFGGAMVIHRNLMRIVPFDPEITRGEDTDYVINSRIFGFNFFLDNQLAIKHLPPPKTHPVWKRFREDIYRFLYGKSKFETQYPKTNIHLIKPEDFDPYPGQFMKKDLGDKIFKTNIILALDYLANGDVESCKETIKNIYLARYDAVPHKNTFEKYMEFQIEWRKLLERTKEFGNTLKDIINSGIVIKHDRYIEDKSRLLKKSGIIKDIDFKKLDIFKDFTDKELRNLFKLANIIKLKNNEFIFKAGEKNNCVYIVLQGTLVIKKHHSVSGDEIIVTELHQGDHFNETSIFFDEIHSVTIQATSEVDLLVIKSETLRKIINENSPLSTKILWVISKELSERLIKTTKQYSDSKEMNSDVSDLLNGDK